MKNLLSIHQKINVRTYYIGLNTNLARVSYIVTNCEKFNNKPF
jgi:hypothetical protein